MPINLLTLVYTGNGKGKTTAALGLALRSLRDNKKVILIQFIKSAKESGEIGLKKILKKLEIKNFGAGFIINNKNINNNKKIAQDALIFIKNILKNNKYNLIILDEIFVAYNLQLIKLDDIIKLIKINKNILVLTGRGCPKSLYKYADLVTEMKEIKHPYKKGIQAIKGIDF
ncbi:MAG: cob(I)yrinic acid a,c-diamide adenosyltransferase [Patescibacteria group bacterium]